MSKKRVLLVCTGNTCRSPLAEVLLRCMRPDWEVQSAGVMASPGPASSHSRTVAAQRGLSLEDHQAQRVTPALLEWADHIVCMTEGHRRALERDHPGSGAQTLGREISDPVGQTLPVYERCAEQIEQALQAWLAQQNQ